MEEFGNAPVVAVVLWILFSAMKEFFAYLGKLPSAQPKDTPQRAEERDARAAFLKEFKDITLSQISDIKTMVRNTEQKTERLYEMHDKTDTDGVPVWYVRSSLESAISSLAENISAQTEVMRELAAEVRTINNGGK